MSFSPEGRTRGIFPRLKITNEPILIPPKQQESIICRKGSKRFPWSKASLFTAEFVPTVTLTTGFIINDPVVWISSAIILAAEGAGIYLYNMSKFIQPSKNLPFS